MKTERKIKAGVSGFLIPLLVTVTSLGCEPVKSEPNETRSGSEKSQRIMLALLLDTSNSMDGLIDQAKSQLWKIVNELAAATCDDGGRPEISIALYEYGNDGLPASEGYIRLVSPLTSDLDVISEKLFALRTNGGSEFCGHVINKSLGQLAWSESEADLKMIFIAGNEPFTQGEVPYRTACTLARTKGVFVNTIFCGDFDEGVRTYWKDGADIANGTYMSIEQNKKTVYIPTPYDDQISALNDRLNATYVYYGQSGAQKKEKQLLQDKNAESYGLGNKVDRAVSKSSHAYGNATWDLVDATKDDATTVEKVDEKYLPEEMQGMTVEERKGYVSRKAAEREKIQKEIQTLHEKRKQYIAGQAASGGGKQDKMLDDAMLKAIREKAATKNLTMTSR